MVVMMTTLSLVPQDNESSEPRLTSLSSVGTPPAIEWLVEGIVARGNVTMLAGEAKAGKSRLALQWATAVAERRAVAIVDGDNPTVEAHRRIEDFGFPAQSYHITRDIDLLQEDSISALASLIVRDGIQFLILDSWRRLWSGSESADRQVDQCLGNLQALARDYNVGILILHHAPKGSDTYRGSGAIAAAVEAVFVLTRDDAAVNRRVLSCPAMRIAAEPAPLALQCSDDGRFCQVAASEPAPAPSPVEKASAVGQLANTMPNAAQMREINNAAASGTLSKREARRMLGVSPGWRFWR